MLASANVITVELVFLQDSEIVHVNNKTKKYQVNKLHINNSGIKIPLKHNTAVTMS